MSVLATSSTIERSYTDADIPAQFQMKFTKGNAVVTFEKLGFLQKAHAHTLIQGGGLPFEKLVDKIKAHVESHISASER